MIDWIKLFVFFVGGLALFLYGMELMSESLVKVSGSRIRNILNTFTGNRFSSFLTGTVATAIIQSSSAVSVMVVGLVDANLLPYTQTFGILLGAGIGTTITAQIIAFKIAEYALLIIATGFFLRLFSKHSILVFSGSALMGFGLLFYGLHIMSDAMIPMRSHQPFLNILTSLENPFLGIVAGLIFTAIIQSSSAFIGILIVLSSQNLLSLDAAIPLLLGSNIGTTATALIASIKAQVEAKRVAFTFLFIKLTGVLLVCWWIPTYIQVIEHITTWFSPVYNDMPRQIANAHTLFNIAVSVLLIPFTGLITKLIIRLMPVHKKPKHRPVEFKYLTNSMLDQPALALSLAKKETIEMSLQVKKMLEVVIEPFITKQRVELQQIEQYEKAVDFYQNKIVKYVTKISQQNISEDLVGESFKIIYIVSELEEIADVVYNSLLDKALVWINSTKSFSEEGIKELKLYHTQILELYNNAIHAFESFHANEISRLKKQNKLLRNLSIELKQKHFSRLSHNNADSIASSERHREIISNLRTIQSHIANIMRLLY